MFSHVDQPGQAARIIAEQARTHRVCDRRVISEAPVKREVRDAGQIQRDLGHHALKGQLAGICVTGLHAPEYGSGSEVWDKRGN